MEIKVVERVLGANETQAAHNRDLFRANNVWVLNMMSSPGSGKTTMLVRTLTELNKEMNCAVVVGDVSSTWDADHLAAAGSPVVQVNTDQFGGDCHLAAHVVERAVADLDLADLDLLVIENIGNLVCPAEFDIGENARVVVLSVTEGEDKPIKYPVMFRLCDAAIINKIDLLPHLQYDLELTRRHIHQVHPEMPIFEVSAQTGAGYGDWLNWLRAGVRSLPKMSGS